MKILLIADREGWAYDILAKSIKAHSKYKNIEIKYMINIRENIGEEDFSDYDVVYFFLWFDAMRYGPRIKGFDFLKTFVGVHSHGWKKRGLTIEQTKQICEQFAAVGYISKELGEILKLENGYYTPNGVEKSIFYPSKFPKTDEIRLMWVGNPGDNHHGENKGFNSIIKPAISELSSSRIKLVTATPKNPVSRENMGDFYRDNHILLCSSREEGGPMPIIESLACGRPVISTRVGIVPETVSEGENGLIIKRTKGAFVECLKKILENEQILVDLANGVKQHSFSMYCENMVDNYDRIFDLILQKKGES